MEKILLESDAIKQFKLPDYHRQLYGKLPWENHCTAILGPRGVGKTTLLLQRLRDLDLPATRAVYADMGDLYFAENRLYDFARAYADQGGRYLLLDEVHRYPLGSWAQEIKLIVDRLRDKLTVVFTGSSVIKLLEGGADLSRRVLTYRLAGLSLREYLLLAHQIDLPIISLERLLDADGRKDYLRNNAPAVDAFNLSHFDRYLQTGYYPYFLEGETGYINRINASVQLVLAADIPHATATRADNVLKLTRLLAAVADSVPFTPNLSKLGERVGISRNQLVDYLTALERANLLITLRKEVRGIAALGKPDKIYLDNPNLLNALAPGRAERGTVRETFFANQLLQLTYTDGLLPPRLLLPKKGDFIWWDREARTVFEVGGSGKTHAQVRGEANAYVVVDGLRAGGERRVPLWMFGLLY